MRLIDADALMHSHCVECTLYQKTCDGEHRDKCDWDCILHIEEAPTVDAVTVIASDRNKICPINHGLRCKDIDNCAFWCEWGQCAVKAIAVACADGERRSDD